MGVGVSVGVSVGKEVRVIVSVTEGNTAGVEADPGKCPVRTNKTITKAPKSSDRIGPATTTPTGRLSDAEVPEILDGILAVRPDPASNTIPQTAQREAESAIRVPQDGQMRLGIAERGLVFDIDISVFLSKDYTKLVKSGDERQAIIAAFLGLNRLFADLGRDSPPITGVVFP